MTLAVARDDGECLAVGEVQVALGVEVADVAQSCPGWVLRVSALRGLVRVAVVFERGGGLFEIQQTRLSGWQFGAGFICVPFCGRVSGWKYHWSPHE